MLETFPVFEHFVTVFAFETVVVLFFQVLAERWLLLEGFLAYLALVFDFMGSSYVFLELISIRETLEASFRINAFEISLHAMYWAYMSCQMIFSFKFLLTLVAFKLSTILVYRLNVSFQFALFREGLEALRTSFKFIRRLSG